MPDRTLCYIYSNIDENCVICHGIEFNDFMASMKEAPKNILLIKHDYYGGNFHNPSGFKYAAADQIDELKDDDIYNYGDFCWVDFQYDYMLDLLTPQDIAEFLYFGHKGRPLAAPFNETLKNKVAYWTHDDGVYSRIYLSDMDEFLPVLSYAVVSALPADMTQPDTLSPTTERTLFELSQNGLLIDCGNVTSTDDGLEVPIYVIGEVSEIDDLINNTQEYIEKAQKKGKVRFNRDYTAKKQEIRGWIKNRVLGKFRKRDKNNGSS